MSCVVVIVGSTPAKAYLSETVAGDEMAESSMAVVRYSFTNSNERFVGKMSITGGYINQPGTTYLLEAYLSIAEQNYEIISNHAKLIIMDDSGIFSTGDFQESNISGSQSGMTVVTLYTKDIDFSGINQNGQFDFFFGYNSIGLYQPLFLMVPVTVDVMAEIDDWDTEEGRNRLFETTWAAYSSFSINDNNGITPVPIPASFLLLGSGILGMIRMKKKISWS